MNCHSNNVYDQTIVMQQDKEKTITLRTFSDIMDAKTMQMTLSEYGIESFLKDENVLGMDPVAGVELKVFEKDKEAALRIINTN
jgi:hypothetical protein